MNLRWSWTAFFRKAAICDDASEVAKRLGVRQSLAAFARWNSPKPPRSRGIALESLPEHRMARGLEEATDRRGSS